MASMAEAIRGWIDQQHAEIERSSYYQLLGVARTASEREIRDAYYKLVARFHPDLYEAGMLDPDTRRKLVSLYSRLVEAYRVLTDAQKREQYDRALAAGRMRWTPDDGRVAAKGDPESEIANPNARRLFKLAKAAIATGDLRSALINLKMALSVEPENPHLKAELAKVDPGKR